MRAASQRRMTPALALIAAVLAAVFMALLFGLGQDVRWGPPHAAAPLPPASSASALPKPKPLDQFALVWQKPLFSPDRRPVARANDGDTVGDLALTGVILTPSLHMVLVHDKSNNRDLQLQEGKATPDGRWTLVEVRPRSALFDSPDGRVELKLPAGAPFTDQKGDRPQPPGAADMGKVDNDGNSASNGNRRMGLSPHAGRTQRPRGSDDDLQAERIRQLNAVIQKRRAEQTDSDEEGVH